MAMGAWRVASVISFAGNGASYMASLARATTLANASIAKNNGQISASALALQRQKAALEAARMAQLRFLTAGAGIAAGAGLFGITRAVSDAAKLQQILLSIKNETGASNAQIGQFYNTAFKIANQNAMTPVEGAEILRTISRLTAGQFDVAKMMRVAPTVAGFASSIHYNRPEISVDEAARTGIQTAHLFRAYQPAALAKLLDQVYRLSGLMAEKPDAALRQMSYYVPMFKNLGIGNETSIATMALLDRAGFRNKVGTNVRAEVLEALGPLQMTKHAQQGKLGLLEQMGIFKNGKFAWNNRDGTVNFFGELTQLGTYVATEIKKGVTRGDIAKTMFGAFGKQGGTIASLFGDPQMVSILAGIQKYLHDPNVGLASASQNRQLGLGFQFTRAVANLNAVMTELGYPWLTDLTKFFKNVGDNLHNFQQWLHSHRDSEKQIGAVVAGLTAVFGAFAVFGTIRLAVTALGIGQTATSLMGLAGAVNTFMLGAYVNMSTAIPGALMALRSAIFSFALTVGSGGVAAIPGALGRLGLSLLAIAGPVAAAIVAIGALVAFIQTAAGDAAEGKVRPGGGRAYGKGGHAFSGAYGSLDYWKWYASHHGVNALPSADLRREIGPMLARPRGHGRTADASGKTTHVHIAQIVLPATANMRDAGRQVADFLGGIIDDPRITLSHGGAVRTAPGMATLPVGMG